MEEHFCFFCSLLVWDSMYLLKSRGRGRGVQPLGGVEGAQPPRWIHNLTAAYLVAIRAKDFCVGLREACFFSDTLPVRAAQSKRFTIITTAAKEAEPSGFMRKNL